jgi:hypothetical protein
MRLRNTTAGDTSGLLKHKNLKERFAFVIAEVKVYVMETGWYKC